MALYEAGDASQWERVILEYARETAEYGVRLLTAALEEVREDQALEGSFGPAMAQDRQALAQRYAQKTSPRRMMPNQKKLWKLLAGK